MHVPCAWLIRNLCVCVLSSINTPLPCPPPAMCSPWRDWMCFKERIMMVSKVKGQRGSQLTLFSSGPQWFDNVSPSYFHPPTTVAYLNFSPTSLTICLLCVCVYVCDPPHFTSCPILHSNHFFLPTSTLGLSVWVCRSSWSYSRDGNHSWHPAVGRGPLSARSSLFSIKQNRKEQEATCAQESTEIKSNWNDVHLDIDICWAPKIFFFLEVSDN